MVTIIRSDSRRSKPSLRTAKFIVNTYRPIRNANEIISLWEIIVRLIRNANENISMRKIIVRPIRNAKEKWTHWRKCHPIATGQKKRSALKTGHRGFICLYGITNSLFCFLILLKLVRARFLWSTLSLFIWKNCAVKSRTLFLSRFLDENGKEMLRECSIEL